LVGLSLPEIQESSASWIFYLLEKLH